MTSNNQDKASFQTDYVRLNVEQKDSVLLIELNRPEKYNAFDSLMIQELSKALTEYEQRDELRCALLYARGENFTTGLDLMELQDKVLSGIFDYPNDCIDTPGVYLACRVLNLTLLRYKGFVLRRVSSSCSMPTL